MINENFKIEKEEKKSYPPLPENIYQVELLDVNLDKRPTYDTRLKPDNEKIYEKVLKFQFTLLSGNNGTENLRGRNVWDNFVQASLYVGKNGKNKLYQIIEAILGRCLTQEEEANFESSKINGLIGKQLRIGVKTKRNGDKSYDNIESYYKVDSQLPALDAEEKEEARVKTEEEKALIAKKSPREMMSAGYPPVMNQNLPEDDYSGEIITSDIPF